MGDVFVNRMENAEMILGDAVLGFDTAAFIPVELGDPLQLAVNQRKIILPNRTVPIMELGKRLLQNSRDGDTDAVRELMGKGAPFSTDWLGTSPLHFAAQGNHVKTCEALLRAGISKDARTKVDRTPLHMAAYEGHVNIVELLLKNGADVDSKDMLKMTPLHWAVQNEHVKCIQMLLQYGATVDVVSKFDKTPTSMAMEQNRMDIVHMLQHAVKTMTERAQNMELQRATLAATESLTQELQDDTPEIVKDNQSEKSDNNFSSAFKILDNLTLVPNNPQLEINNQLVVENGKLTLNLAKSLPSEAPPLEPLKPQPIKVKGRKVITLRSDQFLALTGGKYQHMFKKINGNNMDVKPIKRIVMAKNKITVAPKTVQLGQIKINTLEKIETITKQLHEARRIAEEYKQKYKQKEKECEEYEKQLKLLTFL